jgi:uncharacterized protein (DUF2336 family)
MHRLNYGLRVVQNSESSSLFFDLDAALQRGSSEKPAALLRQLTDLLPSEAERLDEEQIGVFDDLLLRLIEKIEAGTLIEISERIAPVSNAPVGLTLHLARHSEIEIARPVLTNSSRLTTAELVDITNTMSQDHLLAISKRARLEMALTDLLLDRGNEAVFNSVAGNFGASFSETGFAVLLKSVRAIVAPAAVNEPRETEARA